MYVCNPRGTETGHSLGLGGQPISPALVSFRPMGDLVCFISKVADASLWPSSHWCAHVIYTLREYGCDEEGKCGR